MGRNSQPGPDVYVGAICMVEAPESQGGSQQDHIPSLSYPSQQHKGSQRL